MKMTIDKKIFKDYFKQDILSAFRIPLHECNIDSGNLHDLDYHFRQQIYKSYDYKSLFIEFTAQVTAECPIEYIDALGLHYFIFIDEFDDTVCNINTHYLIMGPFLYESYSLTKVFEIMSANSILPDLQTDIVSFYNRITIISDVTTWNILISNVMSRFFQHKIEIHTIDAATNIVRNTNDTAVKEKSVSDSTIAFASIEARYEVEQELIEAVKRGDVKKALYYNNLFYGFTLVPTDNDPVQEGKDMLIAVNTFLRKAVQDVYVHPLYIDDLNRKETLAIKQCNSYTGLKLLCASMIRKYCLLVKSYSRVQYSELVRNCMNYIDFHYMEHLSLEVLAKKNAVSKTYLSAVFKKETAQTITDYINETRVRRSTFLLNTTSLSIQNIAEQCGFSDSNYFTRTFKRQQNMTPMQYRKLMLNLK
ncbi:MAG: AraC family transcriptional regulator [Lachnospiraceae bacterium]|nr:AraC family transcriptional regulator [Lachnospiraceae bacterium]